MQTQPTTLPGPSASAANAHYDDKYFAWQAGVGEFGGWANSTKFQRFVKTDDSVLDFGCGGGFLLENLNCRQRTGVEVNPTARARAEAHGIQTFASVDEVPDDSIDVIVSNHALEHVEWPLEILKKLRTKLKPGHLAVFVVPCESVDLAYRTDDINQHLYTWSPQSLANLFLRAGFEVDSCEPLKHRWPPNYRRYAKLGGRRLFDLACRVWARIDRSVSQVHLVARRPK